MKSYLTKLLIPLVLVSFFLPLLVSADVIALPNPLVHNTFEELLEAIIDFLAFRLGPAIAVIMFIVAGFHFVTATGEPEKVETAKKIILWTLIGLLVLFCAKGLVVLFKEVVGVETF